MPDSCPCATRFTIRVGRVEEYRRARKILDKGKHPTFIGRNTVERCARDGGLLFIQVDDVDAAVVLIKAKDSTLQALNIHPDHRGHGLGGALMAYIRPNFARVIDYKVAWFTRQGYVAVGEPKQGRRFQTQVMVRAELRGFAGRVQQLVGSRCRCTEQPHLTSTHDGACQQDGISELPMPHAGDSPDTGVILDTPSDSDQPNDPAASQRPRRNIKPKPPKEREPLG